MLGKNNPAGEQQHLEIATAKTRAFTNRSGNAIFVTGRDTVRLPMAIFGLTRRL